MKGELHICICTSEFYIADDCKQTKSRADGNIVSKGLSVSPSGTTILTEELVVGAEFT